MAWKEQKHFMIMIHILLSGIFVIFHYFDALSVDISLLIFPSTGGQLAFLINQDL